MKVNIDEKAKGFFHTGCYLKCGRAFFNLLGDVASSIYSHSIKKYQIADEHENMLGEFSASDVNFKNSSIRILKSLHPLRAIDEEILLIDASFEKGKKLTDNIINDAVSMLLKTIFESCEGRLSKDQKFFVKHKFYVYGPLAEHIRNFPTYYEDDTIFDIAKNEYFTLSDLTDSFSKKRCIENPFILESRRILMESLTEKIFDIQYKFNSFLSMTLSLKEFVDINFSFIFPLKNDRIINILTEHKFDRIGDVWRIRLEQMIIKGEKYNAILDYISKLERSNEYKDMVRIMTEISAFRSVKTVLHDLYYFQIEAGLL